MTCHLVRPPWRVGGAKARQAEGAYRRVTYTRLRCLNIIQEEMERHHLKEGKDTTRLSHQKVTVSWNYLNVDWLHWFPSCLWASWGQGFSLTFVLPGPITVQTENVKNVQFPRPHHSWLFCLFSSYNEIFWLWLQAARPRRHYSVLVQAHSLTCSPWISG